MSYWSSDVCSSYLLHAHGLSVLVAGLKLLDEVGNLPGHAVALDHRRYTVSSAQQFIAALQKVGLRLGQPGGDIVDLLRGRIVAAQIKGSIAHWGFLSRIPPGLPPGDRKSTRLNSSH